MTLTQWRMQHVRESVFPEGEVERDRGLYRELVARYNREWMTCDRCGGSGESLDGSRCRKCGGHGELLG